MTDDVTHEATRRELVTAHGVLRYHDVGDGPPLLLLHGSGPGVTGWRNFSGVLGELSAHFRCLVLEFPGFGVSDPADGHPMLTAQDAVPTFLDALGLDAVDVVGNSMGGIVGMKFAISHPERVKRLVTIGGVGRNTFSSGPSEGIKLLMEFTDEPSRERLLRWLEAMVFDRSVLTEQLIEDRWRTATDPETLEIARRMYSTAAFSATMAANAMSDDVPYSSQLHKVKAPTLLTWGRDDRVSPLDMVLAPMREIPDAQLHVFPRCGHWTMIEAREEWLRVVLAFLTPSLEENR